MIKVENIEVWGFANAIRGMRNPMNSWDKSDSWESDFTETTTRGFVVGKNDLDLMKRLYKAGTEHRKYLRQIFVFMDIVAPLYWWKEMDQYRINVTTNSCSTMHKIAAKEFAPEDFSCEHLDYTTKMTLYAVISKLNIWRNVYNDSKCTDKDAWWQMIQLLPSSYNQRRTITMNYENVMNIIKQRTGHKLDEWNDFVEILRDLPYIKEIRE